MICSNGLRVRGISEKICHFKKFVFPYFLLFLATAICIQIDNFLIKKYGFLQWNSKELGHHNMAKVFFPRYLVTNAYSHAHIHMFSKE